MEKVMEGIETDTDATVMCIAIDAGFPSEDALRMFLRRNWETNMTILRKQIATNELQPHYRWLKME